MLAKAEVAELVYAYDSGSYPARGVGSSPIFGTKDMGGWWNGIRYIDVSCLGRKRSKIMSALGIINKRAGMLESVDRHA